MDRRNFLNAALLASAAGLLRPRGAWANPLPTPEAPRHHPSLPVLVVGAGMAGIAAAADLRSKGVVVTVLEGRDRIGGRIWTDRSLGAPLDMGASWIHGIRGNPIVTLARKFKAKSKRTKYEDTLVIATSGEKTDAGNETFDDLLEQARSIAQQSQQDISLADALGQAKAALRFTPEQLLRLDWEEAEVAVSAAEEFSRLSAKSFEEDDDFEGNDVLFPNGYDQIVNGLAKDLDIRLGHAVQKIEYGADQATVTTSQGVFTGSRVIVTLPLGVLKSGSVTFVPELPPEKLAAIRNLGMGTLNKVALRFGASFWPRNQFLSYISPQKGQFPEFLNIHRYTKQPVLVSLTGGDFARSLEPRADADIAAEAVEILRKMFGSSVTEPSGVAVSRWNSDPFSGGSYSHIPTGASFADYDTLAAPVGVTLLFAGEATHRQYPGTVHGAYLSGLRESQRLVPNA